MDNLDMFTKYLVGYYDHLFSAKPLHESKLIIVSQNENAQNNFEWNLNHNQNISDSRKFIWI